MNQGDTTMDLSSVTGYAASCVYGIIGFVQTTSADIAGYGMLAIAAFSAISTHFSRVSKRQYEASLTKLKDDFDRREEQLIGRLEILLRGLPCEHVECPVVATIKRKGK